MNGRSKKRERSHYHGAIFGSDDDNDDLKVELLYATAKVTKIIAAQ